MRCFSVCVRKLIRSVPLLKNSKKAANVLNNVAGVFARERLRRATLPKPKGAGNKLVLYLSHPFRRKDFPTVLL
jgi:hypothetical protein